MTTAKPRIQSIDLLKGLVMIIMALDHVRDYFHISVHYFNPSDPESSTWPIYLTRYITHFCAPAFSFLAGLSAYLVGKRKTKKELSFFLLTRGMWLVFIELTIVAFGWSFDPHLGYVSLQVIWALGVSMIVLAGLIHLPKLFILIFSCILIFGHNLLDSIHVENSIGWYLLHQQHYFQLPIGPEFFSAYALIPWIGVMSLGYYFGQLYESPVDQDKRKKILRGIGVAAIALFILLKLINQYGDPVRWTTYEDISKTLMSFFNITKYPPSLQYLLLTLGVSILFLAWSEKWRGKLVDFFCVYGRVPFFYYILHIYLIHLIALLAAEYSGYGWRILILHKFIGRIDELRGYGFNLWIVYAVWIFVVLALYPLCKKFDRYKQSHKEKKWLSYL
ncbi:MAG: DUF1624 domain-containing protein [Terrimonas sp.]|nr:DUF1624 domain-containing protein [Terrimonas sp.]